MSGIPFATVLKRPRRSTVRHLRIISILVKACPPRQRQLPPAQPACLNWAPLPRIRRKQRERTLEAHQPKENQLTLIEFCCSPDSLLCNRMHANLITRLDRLTEKEDMTTTEGMTHAMKLINPFDAGCTTLFGALPCTWGS